MKVFEFDRCEGTTPPASPLLANCFLRVALDHSFAVYPSDQRLNCKADLGGPHNICLFFFFAWVNQLGRSYEPHFHLHFAKCPDDYDEKWIGHMQNGTRLYNSNQNELVGKVAGTRLRPCNGKGFGSQKLVVL